MKRCTKCGQEKPEEEFHWRSKAAGTRIARCRDCASEWSKNHYKANKPMYIEKARRWNSKNDNENRLKVIEYLASHPCVDCGESDPVVLQFDHVRGEKVLAVAQLLNNSVRWDRIETEIRKCEIRCANCHIRRTSVQLNWWKQHMPLMLVR